MDPIKAEKVDELGSGSYLVAWKDYGPEREDPEPPFGARVGATEPTLRRTAAAGNAASSDVRVLIAALTTPTPMAFSAQVSEHMSRRKNTTAGSIARAGIWEPAVHISRGTSNPNTAPCRAAPAAG